MNICNLLVTRCHCTIYQTCFSGFRYQSNLVELEQGRAVKLEQELLEKERIWKEERNEEAGHRLRKENKSAVTVVAQEKLKERFTFGNISISICLWIFLFIMCVCSMMLISQISQRHTKPCQGEQPIQRCCVKSSLQQPGWLVFCARSEFGQVKLSSVSTAWSMLEVDSLA